MQMLPTVHQVEWELTRYQLCVLHLAKFLMFRVVQGTLHLHHANQVMIDDEIDDKTVVDRMTNVTVVLASDPLGSAGVYCLAGNYFIDIVYKYNSVFRIGSSLSLTYSRNSNLL